MRGRIKLTENGGIGTEIEVEGARIENGVRALIIEASTGGSPRISLELGTVEAVDVDGHVKVLMTGATRDALIALGWTPPPEV
jgi:hypothetical protein